MRVLLVHSYLIVGVENRAQRTVSARKLDYGAHRCASARLVAQEVIYIEVTDYTKLCVETFEVIFVCLSGTAENKKKKRKEKRIKRKKEKNKE